MYNIAILTSGVSIAVSIFLIAVTLKARMQRKAKILSYIGAVFVVILASNVVYVLQTFSILPGIGHIAEFFLIIELVILLLFYAAVSRGLG